MQKGGLGGLRSRNGRKAVRKGDVPTIDRPTIVTSDVMSGHIDLGRDSDAALRRFRGALADSEALLRAAFDESPVGTLLVRLNGGEGREDGRLLKVNRTFAALTGYRQAELLRMPFVRLLPPADRSHRSGLRALLDGGGEPVRLLRADGSDLWVRLSGADVALGGRHDYVVVHVEDVTSSRQIEEELAQRALHDPLTGLANRHLLLDRFRLAVDNLDRHPGAIVVLHIDLDRFKDVNDTYGHSVGDHVLAEVGRRLDALVDSPDTAARLAGDEFVIVMAARAARRGATAVTRAATRLAEQVSDAISEVIRLPDDDEVALQLSVSIGISMTSSADSAPEQLLSQADQAMFEAKRRGRRRYELFRQGLGSVSADRLRVEQDAREAVANGWLQLHYQPVIDLATGRLGGAEALLRIAHPQRGLLAPGSFIDVIEDSDLILPIGDWVMREAIRQLTRWQRIKGFESLSMAVNVSGRQASDSALTGRALEVVAAAGIDPHSLCLEMTERVLIDADDEVVADLHRLTQKGVQIALDDFGTGYASLSYLQRFPVSTLKIDRSFVTGIGVTTTDTAIVASIVALARALDLDVVAEGVETAGQLEQLRTHECAKAQGFYFAPPLEADALTEVLLQQTRKYGQ
jgi:diguanylate cyclase (GGDEF)-like protein/PAS domain S-box-containing protein